MACPTCDSTMHCIGDDESEKATKWLCPRCGTVKTKDGETYVPKLVERVRAFVASGIDGLSEVHEQRQAFLESLHVTGVLEAAYTPDERPKIA